MLFYFKAKLRLPGHPWSSKFSLDAVGDSGKVTCKTNDGKKFEVNFVWKNNNYLMKKKKSRKGCTIIRFTSTWKNCC